MVETANDVVRGSALDSLLKSKDYFAVETVNDVVEGFALDPFIKSKIYLLYNKKTFYLKIVCKSS
ncbi:hypothetical protein [Petrotoga sp. 9PWA.NaAc.5.4]|uniref:hypothetical protein n=1 Tax=Petrotoga sp. 9PWA.NaAc.5.4 TaxID=1434328 RepID=UPI0011B5C6E3|nr:hypothetical protein [Petrotoga sp. 9PWA.NaAc.5.4]